MKWSPFGVFIWFNFELLLITINSANISMKKLYLCTQIEDST